jgi:Type II secretion system (T2SS), protein M subtype b
MSGLVRFFTDKVTGLLLMLLALAPIALAGWFMWTSYGSKAEETAEMADRYDRLRSIAAFNPDKLLATGSENPVSKYFLGEGTPAILTASLQAKIRELAGQQGVEVVQASELSLPVEDAAISKLGIRLEMSGPAKGILAILSGIEASEPWLFVGNVQLRSGFAEGVDESAEPPMTIGMDVWGVIAKPAVKAVAP